MPLVNHRTTNMKKSRSTSDLLDDINEVQQQRRQSRPGLSATATAGGLLVRSSSKVHLSSPAHNAAGAGCVDSSSGGGTGRGIFIGQRLRDNIRALLLAGGGGGGGGIRTTTRASSSSIVVPPPGAAETVSRRNARKSGGAGGSHHQRGTTMTTTVVVGAAASASAALLVQEDDATAATSSSSPSSLLSHRSLSQSQQGSSNSSSMTMTMTATAKQQAIRRGGGGVVVVRGDPPLPPQCEEPKTDRPTLLSPTRRESNGNGNGGIGNGGGVEGGPPHNRFSSLSSISLSPPDQGRDSTSKSGSCSIRIRHTRSSSLKYEPLLLGDDETVHERLSPPPLAKKKKMRKASMTKKTAATTAATTTATATAAPTPFQIHRAALPSRLPSSSSSSSEGRLLPRHEVNGNAVVVTPATTTVTTASPPIPADDPTDMSSAHDDHIVDVADRDGGTLEHNDGNTTTTFATAPPPSGCGPAKKEKHGPTKERHRSKHHSSSSVSSIVPSRVVAEEDAAVAATSSSGGKSAAAATSRDEKKARKERRKPGGGAAVATIDPAASEGVSGGGSAHDDDVNVMMKMILTRGGNDESESSSSSTLSPVVLSPIKRTLHSSMLMNISKRQVNRALKEKEEEQQRGDRRLQCEEEQQEQQDRGRQAQSAKRGQPQPLQDRAVNIAGIEDAPGPSTKQEPFLGSLTLLELSQRQVQRLQQQEQRNRCSATLASSRRSLSPSRTLLQDDRGTAIDGTLLPNDSAVLVDPIARKESYSVGDPSHGGIPSATSPVHNKEVKRGKDKVHQVAAPVCDGGSSTVVTATAIGERKGSLSTKRRSKSFSLDPRDDKPRRSRSHKSLFPTEGLEATASSHEPPARHRKRGGPTSSIEEKRSTEGDIRDTIHKSPKKKSTKKRVVTESQEGTEAPAPPFCKKDIVIRRSPRTPNSDTTQDRLPHCNNPSNRALLGDVDSRSLPGLYPELPPAHEDGGSPGSHSHLRDRFSEGVENSPSTQVGAQPHIGETIVQAKAVRRAGRRTSPLRTLDRRGGGSPTWYSHWDRRRRSSSQPLSKERGYCDVDDDDDDDDEEEEERESMTGRYISFQAIPFAQSEVHPKKAAKASRQRHRSLTKSRNHHHQQQQPSTRGDRESKSRSLPSPPTSLPSDSPRRKHTTHRGGIKAGDAADAAQPPQQAPDDDVVVVVSHDAPLLPPSEVSTKEKCPRRKMTTTTTTTTTTVGGDVGLISPLSHCSRSHRAPGSSDEASSPSGRSIRSVGDIERAEAENDGTDRKRGKAGTTTSKKRATGSDKKPRLKSLLAISLTESSIRDGSTFEKRIRPIGCHGEDYPAVGVDPAGRRSDPPHPRHPPSSSTSSTSPSSASLDCAVGVPVAPPRLAASPRSAFSPIGGGSPTNPGMGPLSLSLSPVSSPGGALQHRTMLVRPVAIRGAAAAATLVENRPPS